MRFVMLGFLAGCHCEPEIIYVPSDDPCALAAPAVDVALAGEPYGELEDGVEVWFGTPPQGGAPYTPFEVRFQGIIVESFPVQIVTEAYDVDDGTLLADTSVEHNSICGNVGENDGWRIGSEVHMRYELDLAELDGREADIEVRVEGPTGTVESFRFRGSLVLFEPEA